MTRADASEQAFKDLGDLRRCTVCHGRGNVPYDIGYAPCPAKCDDGVVLGGRGRKSAYK